MPKVPTNMPKPPNRVFALATPLHLFMKLTWELKRFKENLVPDQNDLHRHLEAAYSAFNFAITAWHLGEWVWESAPKDQQVELVKRFKLKGAKSNLFLNHLTSICRELKICREIANGSKHMTDKANTTIKVSLDWKTAPARVGSLRAGDPLNTFIHELVVYDDGNQRMALEVFEEVMKFWRNFLEDLGHLNPEFVMGEPSILSTECDD